ncbi:MAG: insulinase family protein [Archangium sp.]|nr:insulinase family protein [Archangium sp.]
MTARVFRDVLPSGLTVVTVETPHLHSALAAVYVRVGSRHEREDTNGVSHLLEHLFFRGSARYPNSVRMNASVEAVGGNLNGVTMRDSGTYYTPVHPDGIGVALRILGDMVTRPRLVQLETEKRIILEEMLDEVDERGRDIDVDNLAKRQLFGDHPLALKIAGTPDSVKGLTRRDAVRHFETFYVAGNMVVTVCGPLKHEVMLALAARAFSGVPRGPRSTEISATIVPREKTPLRFVALEEAQVEFRLSFPAFAEAHRDQLALGLLRRVLDDGLSSRLPYRVVEKRGLAYSIGASIEAFHDVGTFDIDAACAPDNVGPVVDECLKTLATLRDGDITAEELTRAKRRQAMHLDFLKDSQADLTGWFGGTELFRRPETFEERSAAARRVTLADLRRVATAVLRSDTMRCTAVGPRTARKPLERVLARADRTMKS